MQTNPSLRLRPRGGARPLALTLGLLLALPLAAGAKPDHAQGKGGGKAGAPGPGFAPPGLEDKGGTPPGLRRKPVEIVVPKAPPALRTEKIPGRPAPHHVWVPGFWTWEAGAYVWVPGVWVAPPAPDALWVPPRWERRSGVSIYISGYWRL